jgi:hypothetical protein
MIYIIAHNEVHFSHFCREVNLPKEQAIYVYKPEILRGIIGVKDVHILMLPEWYRNKSVQEQDMLELMVREHNNYYYR